MEAVRIREGVETEEEVLTGAAIVERQAGRVRVQLKTDVETVEETEEKPKHYRFTLIEFCTRETAKLEARINGSLAKWIEEARRIAAEKAGKKTAEEKYDDRRTGRDNRRACRNYGGYLRGCYLMLTGAKLKIIVRGVKIKVQRGEDLEEILESYENLTEEEKQQIRDKINE